MQYAWMLFALVSTWIVGTFSQKIYNWLESVVGGLLVKLPTWAKPLVAAILAAIISQGAVFLQIQLNPDITKWTPADVQTALGALFAMIQHIAQQQKVTTAAIATNKATIASVAINSGVAASAKVPVPGSTTPPSSSH